MAEIPENKKETGVRRKGTRRNGPLPEDPEALCSILLVNSVFCAKIIYHFFKVTLCFFHCYLIKGLTGKNNKLGEMNTFFSELIV